MINFTFIPLFYSSKSREVKWRRNNMIIGADGADFLNLLFLWYPCNFRKAFLAGPGRTLEGGWVVSRKPPQGGWTPPPEQGKVFRVLFRKADRSFHPPVRAQPKFGQLYQVRSLCIFRKFRQLGETERRNKKIPKKSAFGGTKLLRWKQPPVEAPGLNEAPVG